MLRRLILAASLLASLTPALAQAPPAVPALPDTERRTSYSISTSTCACAVNFALYGDGTDVDEWIQVWVNGVQKLSTDATYGWSLSSNTGPLATIPRPITDAVLTFNSAQSATIQIVGARRPRQLSQFTENRGVAARDLNQRFTDITAIERELWDKTSDLSGRGLFFAPGNVTGPMPQPSACANAFLGFDGTGLNPQCQQVLSSGSLTTPATTTNGDLATFNSTNGKSLGDSGIPSTKVVQGPNSVTNGDLACWNGTGGSLLKDCGSTTTFPILASVTTFGATGNCSTDDTSAFQSAINAAVAAGGAGRVYVPPVASGGCYLVSKLNGTNIKGLTIEGNGDQSLIKITGFDSSDNWLDLSGSYNISLKSLRIINDGSHVPNNIILWACTGTSCVTSGVLNGLTIDHVNIAAASARSFFYGYGYGGVGGNRANTGNGGGALSISNSTWTQLNNGSATCSVTSPNTCNALLHLTALNDLSVTSAYVTIGTGAATVWRTVISNVDFVDWPSGFGGGTLDNNAGIVLDNTNQLTMIGGSVQCVCLATEVLWSNNEGITHVQTAFESSDSNAGSTKFWQIMGGGDNGIIHYDDVLWSSPISGYIVLGRGPTATTGGVQYMTITNADVGLNANSVPFITTEDGTSATCGSFTASNTWIASSLLNLTAGANNIVSCGNLDTHTIIQDPGTVSVAAGGTDSSHHF